MNITEIREGTRVKCGNLTRKPRLCVDNLCLRARKEGTLGVAWKPIPMHEGAWWVRQDNGKIGAYWYHEMESCP